MSWQVLIGEPVLQGPLPIPQVLLRVGPFQAPPLGKGCASRPAVDPCRAGRPWMGSAAAPGAAGGGVLLWRWVRPVVAASPRIQALEALDCLSSPLETAPL